MAKTFDSLYQDLYSFANLYRAYRKAAKGKRGQIQRDSLYPTAPVSCPLGHGTGTTFKELCMKNWILFLILAIILAVVAVTASSWLPPLLKFVGANTDVIQGVDAFVQILFALGAIFSGIYAYLQRRNLLAAKGVKSYKPFEILPGGIRRLKRKGKAPPLVVM